MRNLLLIVAFAFGVVSAPAQQNFRITNNSVGGVKLGMTVSQARRVLKECSLKRSSDGDGATLIAATCAGKNIITVFAGEEDSDKPINENAKIEFIEVWDRRFKTINGIHPEMLIRDAEKRLGPVKEIMLSEIESREFITFKRATKDISYRMYGGIYPPGKSRTKRYEKGTKLFSVQVSDTY